MFHHTVPVFRLLEFLVAYQPSKHCTGDAQWRQRFTNKLVQKSGGSILRKRSRSFKLFALEMPLRA